MSNCQPNLLDSFFKSRSFLPRVSAAFSTGPARLSPQRLNVEKKELLQDLKDEIRMESETKTFKGRLPPVPGFDVTIDGSLVILQKEGAAETVKITVDVINSIFPREEFEEEEMEQNHFESKPPFQVDLIHPESSLVFRCVFSEDDEDNLDAFEIVQFFTHQGTCDPRQYVALGEHINPELYERLMYLLEERGIDRSFATALKNLATAHEHRCYVRCLKGVAAFASS